MFNLKITNMYYYLFAFLGLTTILILLYSWRKIVSLSAINIILEKKYKELKKQTTKNFDTFNEINFDKNDTDMNEIFKNENINEVDIALDMCSSIDIPIIITSLSRSMESDVNVENVENVENIENDNTEIDIVDKIISDTIDDIPELKSKDTIEVDNDDFDNENNDIDNDNISIKSENTTSSYSKSKLNKLNVDKLKDICIKNGGSDEGTKNILIERILFGLYK